jgi:hypothetical protein
LGRDPLKWPTPGIELKQPSGVEEWSMAAPSSYTHRCGDYDVRCTPVFENEGWTARALLTSVPGTANAGESVLLFPTGTWGSAHEAVHAALARAIAWIAEREGHPPAP